METVTGTDKEHRNGNGYDPAAQAELGRLPALIESLLFAAGAPVPLARLVEALDGPERREGTAALKGLAPRDERQGRGVRRRAGGGGWAEGGGGAGGCSRAGGGGAAGSWGPRPSRPGRRGAGWVGPRSSAPPSWSWMRVASARRAPGRRLRPPTGNRRASTRSLR